MKKADINFTYVCIVFELRQHPDPSWDPGAETAEKRRIFSKSAKNIAIYVIKRPKTTHLEIISRN